MNLEVFLSDSPRGSGRNIPPLIHSPEDSKDKLSRRMAQDTRLKGERHLQAAHPRGLGLSEPAPLRHGLHEEAFFSGLR